jgi:hypothetical protein
MYSPALELTQPPIQWVPGVLSMGLKRPVCESDYLPEPSADRDQRMREAVPPLPPVSLHGAVLS